MGTQQSNIYSHLFKTSCNKKYLARYACVVILAILPMGKRLIIFQGWKLPLVCKGGKKKRITHDSPRDILWIYHMEAKITKQTFNNYLPKSLGLRWIIVNTQVIISKKKIKKHFNMKITFIYSGKMTTGSHFVSWGDYWLIIWDSKPMRVQFCIITCVFILIEIMCSLHLS